ncbi:MAG: proliferating cell nuclear antigen (pcna) [Candidatus Woesearchaeota archaeon]|nr:proliferating cell nuclear antigen (pcna) [Candidatus Woesearchaeota archaeon]
MKLTLAEPKYLKESISIISDLVNEARFKVTKDAIELVAMDPANVAMVIYKLLSSSFVEYDVKGTTEFAINMSNLKQILRRAGPSDMLTMELDSDNRLKITLKSASTRIFSLPVIDIEEREQRIPELNFPISIKMPCNVLNNAIDDVDVVGESVSFALESGKFVVSAEGDLSKARIEIKPADEIKIISDVKDNVKAKYSIEYLKKMIGGSKIADEVSIQFNKDYPLKLDYRTINKVELAFILAPRVENE